MSTKTSFKRIALVAASALALGGFSVISAPQASAGNNTAFVVSNLTKVNGVALTAANYTSSSVLDSRGISSFNVTAGDTVTLVYVASGGVTTAATDSITVSMRGFGNVALNETSTVAVTGAPFQSAAGAVGASQAGAFTVTSVAGTYTLDVSIVQTAGQAALTSSVTMVVAASASYSNPLSTAYINSGVTLPTATTNAVAVGASKALGTEAANVLINLKKTNGTAATSGNTLAAEVTGPGYVIWSASSVQSCGTTDAFGPSIGRSIAAQAADDEGFLTICADGSAGTSSVKITITNAAGVATVLATKTVTFYGSVAALSVHKTNFTIGKAGANTTGATVATSDTITYMPAFVIAAKDSAGTLANASAAPTIVPADTTIVSSGTCVLDTGDATYGYGTVGYYNCNFTTPTSAQSGQSTVLTVRIVDPAGNGTTYLTTTVTVTIGGSVATTVLSTDKETYSAGEAMTVTLTAKDSSGNPVFDGAASPAVAGNKAFGGALPAASYFVGGVKSTSTLYAPAVGGEFILTATGTDAAATKLTATGTVEADQSASLALDAANAATDAANNAYDEAQNATQAASDALAAVTALAKQVKTLIANVKKLSKAVAKLS